MSYVTASLLISWSPFLIFCTNWPGFQTYDVMISNFPPGSENSELPTVSLNCLALPAWLKYFLPTQWEKSSYQETILQSVGSLKNCCQDRQGQMLACWPRCQSPTVLISTGELFPWSLHQRRKMISLRRWPRPDLPSLSTPASMRGESTPVVSRLSSVKKAVARDTEIFARNWSVWDKI